MGIKDRIRSFLISGMSVSSYIKVATIYNDIIAIVHERKIKRSPDQRIIDCNLPLVYISQPPRCGGTITRNLLDGHPLLYVYPYELSWEKNGYHWEENLHLNVEVFNKLKDKWISHAINNGVDKKIPFYFNRKTQKKIFLNQKANSVREVLGAYMTSFYNAWNNYQYLYGDKKYCVAFCPWTTVDIKSVERFFIIYPDGFRIHIIRSPYAWWASEKLYNKRELKSIDDYLLPHWVQSTKAGIEMNKKYPNKYILLNYETLIHNTGGSMKIFCDILELPYTKELLTPMLNGYQRVSNTSYGQRRAVIDSSSLSKWRKILNKREIDSIKKNTSVFFDEALSLCVNNIKK